MPLDRLGDWRKFSNQEELHIEQYTRKQYESEDHDSDQVGIWTAAECNEAIKRYTNRFGRNARGPKEALRDCLKIAHYAQFMYDKLKKESGEPDVY